MVPQQALLNHMRTSYKKYKAIINARAKKLRNNSTPAEAELWKYLRKKELDGYKFLRQHPVLHSQNNRVYFFIADFYCHKHKLIIEVDGDIHDKLEQQEYDQMRTATLEEMGLKIIRFKNKEVLTNPNSVIEQIKIVLK